MLQDFLVYQRLSSYTKGFPMRGAGPLNIVQTYFIPSRVHIHYNDSIISYYS